VGHRHWSSLAVGAKSDPGVRYIDGRAYYSADWLNRPPAAAHEQGCDTD
jgi:hypothetical protein